ncbi:MAG TPA: YeeE/YedE thiosulfate transporter family protein [Polyangiaceae bacterium]
MSSSFTPVSSTLGGVLLGIAASALLLANGEICGISGIMGSAAFARRGDRVWRLVFLAGLLAGGAIVAWADRPALAVASEQSMGLAALSGVLVGVGTRMGEGCTSGHGLCGIARFSGRSIVATLVFMATGAATVFVLRHVIGVAAGVP